MVFADTAAMKVKKSRKRSPLSFINKRRDAGRTGSRQDGGIEVVDAINLTFASSEDMEDCSCPVCAELAMTGAAQHVVDAEGVVRKLYPKVREMIELTIHLCPRLAVHTYCESRKLSIPAGCNMMDMLEYLRYKYPSMQREFGPLSLSGEINGRLSAPDYVLEHGQVVRVDGHLDAEMSAMMSPLFF